VIDLEGKVTQAKFGELVGISQPAVSDLLSRGIIAADACAGEWLKAYCSHLREQAAGRLAAGDLDLAAERAALARAQRERIEMQNAQTRGELAPVILIEEVLTKAAAKIAGIFEAIPGMLRRRVASLTADDIEMVAGEIAKARNMVASISLADVLSDGKETADVPESAVEEEG
jgi:terminase small subunit / prophage DNA-packing protein